MSEYKIKTTDDDYRALDELLIYELEELFRGNVIFPSDDHYEDERQLWNGQIDKYPTCIIKCLTKGDVVAAVEFATKYSIKVAIRSTGHHVAGSSSLDHGMIIDLSEMKRVTVDSDQKVASAQPGVTWADLDSKTQQYNLATPGGVVSDTGIAGLTLGGGYGWLRRKYGLSSDNVIELEVVTGTGDILTVNENENHQLFHALKGGGGNFGIVTKFKYKLHKVGPNLHMGITFYPLSNKTLRDYIYLTSSLEEEITSMALIGWVPDEDDFPAEHHNKPTLVILSVYSGDPDVGETKLSRLKTLADPLFDLSETMPYTQIQQFFDADYPRGMQYYWSSIYVDEIRHDLIEKLIEGTLKSPSKLTTVDIWHLGGAIQENEGQDAISFRNSEFLIGIESNWMDPKMSAHNIAWNQHFRHDLLGHTSPAGYINFSSGEEGFNSTIDHYRDKLQTLRDVKQKFDPMNIFYSNIPIRAQE